MPSESVIDRAIDLDRVRADTPATARFAHLDNAGSALPPRQVVDAVVGHLHREAEVGGYRAAEEAAEGREGFYTAAAELLGCGADEIAFAESATRAWHLAFAALDLGPDDVVLTHRVSYASNFLSFLHRRVRVEVVPSAPDGTVDLDALARLLPGARLVALTHVPTNSGLVNPAEAVGRLARDAGVPYLLDACQSVGQLPVDVARIGCDLLSATGRKFLRGPRGTGLLYVRRGLDLQPPFVDLHAAEWTAPDRYRIRDDARRFEVWERSIADQLGLAEAIRYANALGLPAIEGRVVALAERLRTRLAELPGVAVHDPGTRRCGIVTFTVDGIEADAIKTRLRAEGVHVSVSSPGSTLLDARERGLQPMVRASVHYYNTDTELDRLVEIVARAR